MSAASCFLLCVDLTQSNIIYSILTLTIQEMVTNFETVARKDGRCASPDGSI